MKISASPGVLLVTFYIRSAFTEKLAGCIFSDEAIGPTTAMKVGYGKMIILFLSFLL
jgi:hypothetical protein